MDRHRYAVDLLRSEMTLDYEVRTFGYKQELTKEDFDTIIEKAELVKKAAKIAKINRYGK